jgi:hypothetical protein
VTGQRQLYSALFQLLEKASQRAFRAVNATLGAEKTMTRYSITTGMQTVTAAGPVTGTLSTAALTHLSTLYLDVTGLTSGSCRISIEDSASGTFGDALPVKVWHFLAGEPADGITVSANLDEIPNLRSGATGNALRVNVLALSAGASLSLTGTADA